MKRRSDLAFEEEGINHATEVWRVVSTRSLPNEPARSIRHTNWFATERAARAHAKWIEETVGGKVHLVQGFAALAQPKGDTRNDIS